VEQSLSDNDMIATVVEEQRPEVGLPISLVASLMEVMVSGQGNDLFIARPGMPL
jgi:hypothetical protein